MSVKCAPYLPRVVAGETGLLPEFTACLLDIIQLW
jgi:hypothetical protein